MNAQCPKRGRSPCPATKPPRRGRRPHGPTDEPHPCPCECPAFQEVRRLEARVAELEAELKHTTALLTDAFHDDPAVQTLRRRMEPANGRDTYAAAASRSAWRDRVTAASLGAIRAVRESGHLHIMTVDPAVTASWCVPHTAVPSVVAARVVMPFVTPDVVIVSAGPTAAVATNAPAAAQIGALHALVRNAEVKRLGLTFADSPILVELLSRLCAVQLPTAALERLAGVRVTHHEQPEWVETLRVWCLFRLGRMSLDGFLAAATVFSGAQIVFGSQVAVDEFFLPMASQCRVVWMDRFAEFLECADVEKVATAEFCDQFFLRLANSLAMTAARMKELALALTKLCVKAAPATQSAFLKPRLVLDFCVRGISFLLNSSWALSVDLCDNLSTIVGSVAWPLSLVPSVRDRFLLPTMRWAVSEHARRNGTVAAFCRIVTGPLPSRHIFFEVRDSMRSGP